MVAALCLFAVVAMIWAGVGYVYADHDRVASATKVGLLVLGVGWLAVLGAAGAKFLRLRARRRDSAHTETADE
ncbi:MAG: hypothetical protein WBQ44_03055 [Rhodococcus sp. (in: high G+C Gram-positive bacteria)]